MLLQLKTQKNQVVKSHNGEQAWSGIVVDKIRKHIETTMMYGSAEINGKNITVWKWESNDTWSINTQCDATWWI